MKDIEISKSSRIFKFMKFMNHTPLGGLIVHYDRYDETIDSFNDICTFVRHFLYVIFLAIPAQIFLIIAGIYLLGSAFIIAPITALYHIVMNQSGDMPPGAGILYFYIAIITSYLILCVIQHALKNKKISVNIKLKQDGFIANTVELISAKHSSFCNRIKMKD